MNFYFYEKKENEELWGSLFWRLKLDLVSHRHFVFTDVSFVFREVLILFKISGSVDVNILYHIVNRIND